MKNIFSLLFLVFLFLCVIAFTARAELTKIHESSINSNSFATQAEAENGSSTTKLMSPLRVKQAINSISSFESKLFHVRDEKSSGVSGGTFTFGSWQTRELNTTKTNEITSASLNNNQMYLPSGNFYVEAIATASYVSRHQLKLYNNTNSVDLVIGMTMGSSNDNSISTAKLSGRFSLNNSSYLELRHECNVNGTYGPAAGFGVTEVYSDVRVWELP